MQQPPIECEAGLTSLSVSPTDQAFQQAKDFNRMPPAIRVFRWLVFNKQPLSNAAVKKNKKQKKTKNPSQFKSNRVHIFTLIGTVSG